MEQYKSSVRSTGHNINTVFDKLSEPARYKQLVEANADRLPEEARKHLDNITFGDDHIAIQSPMGAIKLGVDHEATVAPTRIVYSAMESPVKFALTVNLEKVDEANTNLQTAIELDIPFFMAKMVAPQLKDGAEKFGEALSRLPYDNI